MIHLDTHVLVWLYDGSVHKIPAAAQQRMETDQLVISPMVELELAYLFEVGKVVPSPATMLAELRPALELVVSTAPFPVVVGHALDMTWTRDPFDRLIAAQAVADNAALLTADHTILANLQRAIWP